MHSPGPWEVVDAVSRGIVIMFHDPDRDRKRDLDPIVCHMHWFPGYAPKYVVDRIMADVRLIAAAPDLLEALQALGAKPDGYCFCINQEQINNGHTGECLEAQQAIAKAKGDM